MYCILGGGEQWLLPSSNMVALSQPVYVHITHLVGMFPSWNNQYGQKALGCWQILHLHGWGNSTAKLPQQLKTKHGERARQGEVMEFGLCAFRAATLQSRPCTCPTCLVNTSSVSLPPFLKHEVCMPFLNSTGGGIFGEKIPTPHASFGTL